MKSTILGGALVLGLALVGCGAAPEPGVSEGDQGTESVGTSQEQIVLCNNDLNYTYQAAFGRDANSPEETGYWCGRNVAWSQMEHYMKDWLVSSAGRAEQRAVIGRVYLAVYHRDPSSTESTYWMNESASHGGYTYAEMVLWLHNYAVEHANNCSGNPLTYYTWYVNGIQRTSISTCPGA